MTTIVPNTVCLCLCLVSAWVSLTDRPTARQIRIEGEVQLQDVHARLADESEPRMLGEARDQRPDRGGVGAAGLGDARGLNVGVRRADVRIQPARRRRDGVGGDRTGVVGILLPDTARPTPSRDRSASVRRSVVRAAGERRRRSRAPAADGRGWKYSGLVKFCPMSSDPTTLPSL